MTKASAKVIADSITEDGHRLTTFEATCWRPVLAEQNTHCVLSRNSASSRAIPVTKMLDRYDNDFAEPLIWPSEIKGMQGGPQLTGDDLAAAQGLWESLKEFTSAKIRHYVETHPDVRLHKSMLNRWLEPGLWQTQIISATQWDGYFWQRCHRDAEPHIRVMAEAIFHAREASTPVVLGDDEWHLPYWAENGGHESDRNDAIDLAAQLGVKIIEIAKWCSSARCARVSYLTQDGLRDISEDITLWKRLTTNRVGSEDPPHASPLEHVATPWPENQQHVTMPNGVTMGPLPKLGKFVGWLQLRHLELGF